MTALMTANQGGGDGDGCGRRPRQRMMEKMHARRSAMRILSQRPRATASFALLWLLASLILLASARRLGEKHDPLRDEARALVAGVHAFLEGQDSGGAVLQLHRFLRADSQDLAAAGIGGAGSIPVLGVKDGGWRRHLAFEEGALEVLTDVISESGDPHVAAPAARCLAMLAAANNKVRDGAVAIGTVRLLVKMATQGAKTKRGKDWSGAQAAAAEAIWSLVYSSKPNHAEAVRRGAVPAMVNLAKTTENEWTRMWSIACLHNLAEDYCASSTGACPWVQVSFAARGVQPDRRGQSDHNAAVAVDSSSVRLSMHTQAGAQGVIGLAVSLAAKGPAQDCPDLIFPEASQQAAASGQGLVAWAAAALLKSLAFSHVLHVEIVKAGAVAELTRLSQSSCAIEADTANMALKTLNAVSSTREAIVKMGASSNDAAKIEL